MTRRVPRGASRRMLPNPAFASRVKTTKAKALQMFAYAYPSVEFIGRDGLIDRAMMAREWKQFVEGMYRDGLVTQQQRKAWANPFAATARRRATTRRSGR